MGRFRNSAFHLSFLFIWFFFDRETVTPRGTMIFSYIRGLGPFFFFFFFFWGGGGGGGVKSFVF